MPKNRKKKNNNNNNNNNKKKNNNSNNNNCNNTKSNNNTKSSNDKTLESRHVTAVDVAVPSETTNISNATQTATSIAANTSENILVANNERNNCIDGNAPILNTTDEENSKSKKFACAAAPSSTSFSSSTSGTTNKHDADSHHENIPQTDEKVHTDDASSSSAATSSSSSTLLVSQSAEFKDSSSPQHQSLTGSRETIVNDDESKSNENNIEVDCAEIELKSINKQIIETTISGDYPTNKRSNSDSNSQTNSIVVDSNCAEAIKTGSTTSKDAEIAQSDDAAGSVTLIRTEKIDRETIPELSEEAGDDNAKTESMSPTLAHNQLSIQVKSVTYHLDAVDMGLDKSITEGMVEAASTDLLSSNRDSVITVKEVVSVPSTSESSESVSEKEHKELNFVDSLRKAYEDMPESDVRKQSEIESKETTVGFIARDTVSHTSKDFESKDENISHSEIDETFSEIIAEFDKLDDDIEMAFNQLSKDQPITETSESIVKETLSETIVKSEQTTFPTQETNKADYKAETPPNSIEENMPVSIKSTRSENDPEIVDVTFEEAFSEIVSDFDKLDQSIDLVFSEISKEDEQSEKAAENYLKSPSLSANELNIIVTSPKSSNSSDENLKDKAAPHFVTIEDISEDICSEKPDCKLLPQSSQSDSNEENFELNSKQPKVDNTVTIEDISEDDDIEILETEDSRNDRTKQTSSKDYKTSKISKRIALQTHFMPQIIEPRYLDCIKEENSDLSDIERKDDSDVANSSDTGCMYDDLEDEVFYDNEIYQKANAVYPKIQLDFSKKKRKPMGMRHPPRADAISEEDVQTMVEAKIVEQQAVEEGCSKSWSKNLIPASEQAELIYLNSASSSSSDIMDSDTDTRDTKSTYTDYTDDSETRIKTPTIEYMHNRTENTIENMITSSPKNVLEHSEQKAEKEKEKVEKCEQPDENPPTQTGEHEQRQINFPIRRNNNKIFSHGEISESIRETENISESENTTKNSTSKEHVSAPPVSVINNNFMILENSQLVSNEKLNLKEEENFAENFAKQLQKQKQSTFVSTPTDIGENKNNKDLLASSLISNSTISSTTTTTTTKTTELSEKNLNIHNKISTNRVANFPRNLSSNLEEEFKSIGNTTAKGINRQESAESYCSAQSQSTVSSQCTAIRKGSPNLEEDSDLPAKSLRQICLESLASMPYGKDVLEELATVSQSLEYLTEKPEIKILQSAKSEEISKNIDMSCPLPELPKIHSIELKFEPTSQHQPLSNSNNSTDFDLPPPLPRLPVDLHRSNGGSNLPNYKSYINELTKISTTSTKNSSEQFSKDLENILQKSPTFSDTKSNSEFANTAKKYHESNYNITSSSQLRNNKNTTPPPPPVPPLPTYQNETIFHEHFSNLKNNNEPLNEKNDHRLLAIIRNTSEQQPNLQSMSSKSSEIKSEKITEQRSNTSSNIVDRHSQFEQKKGDMQSPKRHFESDDLWNFLNNPNFFKAAVEKFPTSDLDKAFTSQTELAKSSEAPPAVPKRYSNIETSSFESKKVYENGKLVSEVQNSSHNDRIDENSLASLKKFISQSSLGDTEKSSMNDVDTFKNTFDATDSINKNVANDSGVSTTTTTTTTSTKKIDEIKTTPIEKLQQPPTLFQRNETKTETRKSDDFSYDEFRRRAKERAEGKSKSEIFNTEDIFKEFKRFSENLDRDFANKARSSYHGASNDGVGTSILTNTKVDNIEPKQQLKKQQSSSSHNESERKSDEKMNRNENEIKETKIPIHVENETTTKQESRTETVVEEEIKEIGNPTLNDLKKDFSDHFEKLKKSLNVKNTPPPPPPKTEHKIPVFFDETDRSGTDHATNIAKSNKEINIPIKIERKEDFSKTETSSSTRNDHSSSIHQSQAKSNLFDEFRIPFSIPGPTVKPAEARHEVNIPVRIESDSKYFSDGNQSSFVPHEFKIPVNKVQPAAPAPHNEKREINIPISLESGQQQTNQNSEHITKSRQETYNEALFPRSAPSTGHSTYDIPIKVEVPRAQVHSDEKRRRTYSSSIHEDMYRSDNTSDYWRSTENISSRNMTPNPWRSSVDLSSRVSTPSLDKVVKPIEKEVEICMFGKSPRIRAPRLTASTNNLSYYMPYTPDYYGQPEPFNYASVPNRSTSRRKMYTSCQSVIEQPQLRPMHPDPSRASLPREMNPQAEFIRRKEDELKREYMALEDEREKLLRDLTQFNETLEKEIFETQLEKNAENRRHVIEEMHNFQMSNRTSQGQPRRRSWNLPSLSEEEALQQKMRNEWLKKVAEREDRRMHKVIKITKPNDELFSSAPINQNARKFSDSINVGDEFLRRVKERRTKLNMPADSDWESGAESQPMPRSDMQQKLAQANLDYNVKILENRSEADLKNLPKHLCEFAEFVKKFEEEHKDLGIFEHGKQTTNSITNFSNSINKLSNGVWSPNNNEPFKVSSDNINLHQQQQQQHQQQQHQPTQQHQIHHQSKLTTPPPPAPPLPTWIPQESPQQSRKFRPVKFESPTLSRKYVREGSQHVAPPWVSDANNYNKKFKQSLPSQNSASGIAGTQSFSCSSLNNIENTNCNRFNNNFNSNSNNRFGSTSSLRGKENLQRVHSTGYIKPNEVVYSLKNEYSSEPEIESGRPKRMAQLAHRQIEGIGPTTKDGMPIVLRSEVKQNNQHQWYKKMFQTLHKAKDHDGSIIIRYKSPKGRYSSQKSNGYMSEPEPYYDSDFSSMKYRSVERKPRTISSSSAQIERSYGTLPNPVKPPSSEAYKLQPGKIENFTPGHSSVSEKERKDWWDEVIDIFNGHWDQQKLSPHYSEGNLSRALKDHEYDSDSNLIFRKKEQTQQSALSPIEQKQVYRSVQAGGEPPLLGFRKPAPEKPKGNSKEYIGIKTDSNKIRDNNRQSTFDMEPRSNYGFSTLKSSKSYTMLSSPNSKSSITPPAPPSRNSSKTRSSTTIRSLSEIRRVNPSARHYSCYQTDKNDKKMRFEPHGDKFGTITLRKHGKRESILQQQPTRSKSTGAIATFLNSKFAKENKSSTASATSPNDSSRSRTSLRPHSVRISTSTSPPSRPTSRLTSLRQSSPSPIAFGRSVSKERAFAVEKKRLENTLPLCKRSFASSTNILKDPNLKSPDEVVRAIQSYAHIHPLARSKSVPKTVYSACSRSSSTFQQSLSSIKKKLTCVDKIHSRYHSTMPKSTVSVSREFRVTSQVPSKPKPLTLNKANPISRSASRITSTAKTNSNLSLARSNSTFSIDSTGSKKMLRKSVAISRSKSHDKNIQESLPRNIVPPPPPIKSKSEESSVLKKVTQCFGKSESNVDSGNPMEPARSNTFFQNLFLHESPAPYEDDEFDLNATASVQERAKYFDTFSEKSGRPILFTGRYFMPKKSVSDAKFASYQSRSLSPSYRQKDKTPASMEVPSKVNFDFLHQKSEEQARHDNLCQVHEQMHLEVTERSHREPIQSHENAIKNDKNKKSSRPNENQSESIQPRKKSFSPTREVRIHPHASRSFSPNHPPLNCHQPREFSPTREIRIQHEDCRSYSPPPLAAKKKSFSPSPEIRVPLQSSNHSYLPYGSLKSNKLKKTEFSPTREVRVDQDELLASNRKSRPLGRSCSINQVYCEKPVKSKFSPTREIRISPNKSHSYGNVLKAPTMPQDYSPTREVRISPKEQHLYGNAIVCTQKQPDYSPTREIRISPKEQHTYAATIPRRSKPKDNSFSPTREIRTNPVENRSYSPTFPKRVSVDDSFSPTREARICPSTKQSYVPIELHQRRTRRDSFSPTREVRIVPGQPIDQSSLFQSESLKKKREKRFSPTREVRLQHNRHSFPYTSEDEPRYFNIMPGDDEIHITLVGSTEFVSPSRRRIQTVQKSESDKTIRSCSLGRSDDLSKRGLYYCSELSHSAGSLNELETHERRCRLAHSEKFNDLHRFYTNIERHGQLEKATSATDLRPIRREGEILDFEEWRRIRAHQKAEKEMTYIAKKLKQDEIEKNFLFRPKEIEDVKWKQHVDSGLRCREKSVEEFRDNFEIKSKQPDNQPKSFEAESKKDLHKPFWRGSSVADMATSMEVKYNSDKGWALKKKSKPVETLGLSKKLVSTLSKDQVYTIKRQLNEIYSGTGNEKMPNETDQNENYYITVDKISKEPPGPLIVRCNSSITQEELLEPILRKKEAKQKRYSPQESIKKSIISKSSSSNSIRCASDAQSRDSKQLPRNNIVRSSASCTSTEKHCISPDSICETSKYAESNASDKSKITVIHNDQAAAKKDIKTTIKYFEEKKMEEPPKTIYHAREDSSPDEEEILKVLQNKMQERKNQNNGCAPSPSPVNCHRELSNSVSDLKELFGETEMSRVNFRLPQPPPPPDELFSNSLCSEDNFSHMSHFRELSSIKHRDQLSPFDRSEHQFNSIDCSQLNDVRSIKEKFETPESHMKKSQSDPDLNASNKIQPSAKVNCRNGDVSFMTHKFETKNSAARGRAKERKKSVSPISKISKRRDDRMMPHIDIISKTAALKQEISKKPKSPSPILKVESALPSGEFDRIRYKFESPERSPLPSQLYSSSPDISELRDISSHLSGNWIAHKYPKEDANVAKPKKKIVPQQQRPTSCSPPRNRRVERKIDIFANQKFDPSKHRPKARYVPSDGSANAAQNIKVQKRYTVRKESDVAQSVPPLSFGENKSTIIENGKLPNGSESPYRYYEGDVNIHYKTPIRYECKDIIPDEELARQQAESMIKIYEEERKRKYMQELKDMNNRRHTDNFITNQKSPIPLNRYDEFNADLPEQIKGPKTVAKALYNFKGESSRELNFKKGDYVYIRRQIDSNWYEGEHNGVIGLLPVNYVEIIAKDGVRKPAKKLSEGQARAKFTFQAQSAIELSLNKGELVALTKRVDDNWFEGKIANRKGIFPVSYVEVLTDIGSACEESASSTHVTNNNNNVSIEQLRTNINSEIQSMANRNLPNGFHHKESSQKTGELHVDTDSRPIVYRALYKYRPQNNDELDLLEGDLIHVLEKCDDGWYVGTSQRTGCFGTFPGNYVERV